MNSHIIRLFIILLCSFSVKSEAISFKKSVNRFKAPVMITDVVTFEGEKDYDTIKWPDVLRGWVSKGQVNDWAKENTLDWPTENWSGPTKVWVDWCFQLNSKDFTSYVKEEIVSYLAKHNLQLNSLNTSDAKDLPCASNTIADYRISDVKIITNHVIEVKIELTIKDTDHKKVKTLPIKYSALINALRLRENISKFSPLTMKQFDIKSIIWTGGELPAGKPLENMRLVKSLKANTILKKNYIEKTPDIPIGQRVKIILINGAINISTKGYAMTSGDIGEKIKVRVTGTNTTSDALIVAKGVVNVSV